MSLIGILRGGVKTINDVTKKGGLHATVQFQRTTGSGSDGYDTQNAAKVPLGAILEEKFVQVRTAQGIETRTQTSLIILDVAAILKATNGLGFVKDTDLFTLPDGATQAVSAVGGFIDAGTGHPVATEVVLA